MNNKKNNYFDKNIRNKLIKIKKFIKFKLI